MSYSIYFGLCYLFCIFRLEQCVFDWQPLWWNKNSDAKGGWLALWGHLQQIQLGDIWHVDLSKRVCEDQCYVATKQKRLLGEDLVYVNVRFEVSVVV